MSTPIQLQSSPSPLPFQSAASRVFNTPELVAFVVEDLTQPQLAILARLCKVAASECGRMLYSSPWIDNISGADKRMARLASGVGRWRRHFRDLGLGFEPDEAPNERYLIRLFKACKPLSKLELAGLTFSSARVVDFALTAVASRLVHLTLHFVGGPAEATPLVLQLLSACTGLQHLALEDLAISKHAVGHRQPPTYRLASLTARLHDEWVLDYDSAAWLVKSSKTSLRTITSRHFEPDAIASLAGLPRLEAATFEIAADPELEFETAAEALQLASKSSVAHVTLRLCASWQRMSMHQADVKQWVAYRLSDFDAQSRAKVVVDYVG